MKKIIVGSPPIALKRPRFSTMNGKAFDSQKKLKEAERWEISQQWDLGPISTPVKLDLSFYVAIPESWSKKKRDAHEGRPCIKRPDIDNYIKWSLDVMNGMVFHDDSQVYDIRAYKIYSDNPRTEIIIEHGSNVVKDKHGQ